MPKIRFGEFSPEQLKQARQQKYEETAQERAEHREETLEKRMQEYLKLAGTPIIRHTVFSRDILKRKYTYAKRISIALIRAKTNHHCSH